MRRIERLSPFCRTMVRQGRIPYLLPAVGSEESGQREIRYRTRGRTPLVQKMEEGLGEDVYRIARRIVYCYYDLESEYFILGSHLCLDPADIYLDRDGDLGFMLDDAARSQLYPLMRQLLADRWKDQPLLPGDKEDWLSLIGDCEERARLSRCLITAPEAPCESSEKNLLERIRDLKEQVVRDDRKVLGLWGACFLAGVILSILS